MRKEKGGLEVRRLKEFNVDLSCKWCWRMLVDICGLWFCVLAARYGVDGACELRRGSGRVELMEGDGAD